MKSYCPTLTSTPKIPSMMKHTLVLLSLVLLPLTLTPTTAQGEVQVTSYGSAPISGGNLYTANNRALQRALFDSVQKFFNARPYIDQPTEITKDFTIFINSYSIINRSISTANNRVSYITRVYLDDEALMQWNNIIGLAKTNSTLWYDLYINGNRETTSIYEGVGQLLNTKLKETQFYSATKQDTINNSVDLINDQGYNQAYNAYSNDNNIDRLVYTSISLNYNDETLECNITTTTSAAYKIGSPENYQPQTNIAETDSLDTCINGQLPQIISSLGETIALNHYTNTNQQSFQLIIENMKDMVYINNLLKHLANRRYISDSSLKSLSTTNITYTIDSTFDIKYLSTQITKYIKNTPMTVPQNQPQQPNTAQIPTNNDNTENIAENIAENNPADGTLNQNIPQNNAQSKSETKPYNVEMRRTPTYIRLIF